MVRLAPLALILQGICLYHAYTNKSEQKWYWIILFFPVLGSLFYLYYHFYNRQNVENISEGVKRVIKTNYEVEKLEKEVKFSDTIFNKSRLADKYLELERYDDAIELYVSCLAGFNEDNQKIITNLVQACYLNEDYKTAMAYGDKLIDNKDFFKTEACIGYAWSLYHLDELDRAEKAFAQMDKSYSNYFQRMEYGKFLHQTNRNDEALKKLEEVMEEFQELSSQERRHYKRAHRAIKQLHYDIANH